MNTNKLIPVLLALPLFFTALACPTRTMATADDADGTPATGGHGGARETDAGVDAAAAGSAGAGGAGGAAGAVVTCSPACNSATQACVAGACLLSDGQSCTVASQCASGGCTPFYVDQDGDGYGTGQAVGFCGTATPIGYAAQNGDCCDDSTHLAVARLIHPGAGYQPTSAGGICNITWDYNCTGAVEKNAQMGECGTDSTPPTCVTTYSDFPDSDCGTTVHASACELFSIGSSESCSGAGSQTTLGCR
jgi:hypothetical protein